MEQIEGEVKNNVKGFIENKQVKQLSIFCSQLTTKSHLIENQTLNSFKKRSNKHKTPSFAFIDQKYE